MPLPRIHSPARDRRRRLLALVTVLAVAGAIAVHHVGPVVNAGMGGHHDGAMGPVAELCLGVLTAVGVALATAALVLLAPRRRLAPLVLSATGVAERSAPAPRPPRARAGFSFLCVMRC